MSEAHRVAGQLGGQATLAKYGPDWMKMIGRMGGRPRWQESVERAWQGQEEARKRAKNRN